MSLIDSSLATDRRARWVVPVMIVAAATALGLWVATGALYWRGYPTEYANGRIIAATLGLLVQVILLALGWAAMTRRMVSWGALFLAVGCWSVARLVTASLFPLGSDEAYHWQWAQHLDWCYYDHPAMVAWLARLLAPYGGEATAAVRLSGVVLGALMPPAAAYLAWITLRDGEVARGSALVFMLTPILSGSTFLMPALPLLFFWLLTTIQLWRALESNSIRHWLLLGVVYGCALNCNFTTFLIPICAVGYLLVSPAHRRFLAKPGPYLALVVSGVCFLPVILWNSQHDWRTFGFNFARRHRDLSFHADQLALYLGQFLLYVSPILALGMMVGVVSSLKSAIRTPPSANARSSIYLAAMGLGPLLAFLVTSAALKARAHYAVPALVPLIILFVHACTHGHLRKWLRPAAVTGMVMTMGFWWVLLLTALVPAPTMDDIFAKLGAKDPDKPTAELYGWPALGQYLDSFGARPDAKSSTVVVAISYAQAALAMHYSRNTDFVFSLDEDRSPYGQQFKLWGPLDQIPPGCDAILFRAGRIPDEAAYRNELEKHFQRVEPVNTRRKDTGDLYYFSIWRAYGYRGSIKGALR